MFWTLRWRAEQSCQLITTWLWVGSDGGAGCQTGLADLNFLLDLKSNSYFDKKMQWLEINNLLPWMPSGWHYSLWMLQVIIITFVIIAFKSISFAGFVPETLAALHLYFTEPYSSCWNSQTVSESGCANKTHVAQKDRVITTSLATHVHMSAPQLFLCFL